LIYNFSNVERNFGKVDGSFSKVSLDFGKAEDRKIKKIYSHD